MTVTLVTGAAGRLGRSVVNVLADRGHRVVAVDRVTDPNSPAEQRILDLSDRAATAALVAEVRPDTVVHLAAIAVPFSAPDHETYAVNTGLFFSVLDAALATGTARVLVASSPTVLGYGAPGGWAPQYLPLDEEHPRAPWNGYAQSKAAVEDLVAMAARQHRDRITVGAFRPCYVVAPEEWRGVPTQQGHTIRERLDDPALSAVALFNYVDARDAGAFVASWAAAPSSATNGLTFFVGAGDSLVREPVAEALARLVPSTAPHIAALAPTDPVFTSARAAELIGWRAERSWRTELVDTDVPTTDAAEEAHR